MLIVPKQEYLSCDLRNKKNFNIHFDDLSIGNLNNMLLFTLLVVRSLTKFGRRRGVYLEGSNCPKTLKVEMLRHLSFHFLGV